MEKCPKCNATVLDGQKKCHVCGVDIKKEKEKIERRKLTICPFCGGKLEETDYYCPTCGEKISFNSFKKGSGLSDFDLDAKIESNIEWYQFRQNQLLGLEAAGGAIYKYIIGQNEHLIIPGFNLKIESKVFYKDKELKRVTIEEGLEVIEEDAFLDCPNLKRIDFPSTITKIAGYMITLDVITVKELTDKSFNNIISKCVSAPSVFCWDGFPKDFLPFLKEITFKMAVKQEDSYYLNLVEIREKCKEFLETDIYDYCNKMNVEIKNRCLVTVRSNYSNFVTPNRFINKINIGLFSKNKTLKSIVITDNVTNIGALAFAECKELRSVKLPNKISAINNRTFYKCINLEKIIIPDSVIEVNSEAFKGCKNLAEIKMSNNLKLIGQEAFMNLSKVSKIVLPNAVEFIGVQAFAKCVKLEELVVGNNVKTIKPGAFAECNELKEINISSSLDTIEDNVFLSCSSLEEVDLPESITLIKECAFMNCTSLKTINLDDIKAIQASAFNGCINLKSIDLSPSLHTVSRQCFNNCTSLKSVNLENVFSIEDYAFNGCSSLESVKLAYEVNVINNSVFAGCKALKEINLEDVREIRSNAFRGCISLNSDILSDGIEVIGESAFRDCNFKYLIIPNSVQRIDSYAFGVSKKEDCKDLKVIYIPKGKKFNNLPKGVKVKKYKLEQLDKIKEKLLKL